MLPQACGGPDRAHGNLESMMLAVLGCACVAWTSFELIRLWNSSQVHVRVHENIASARRHGTGQRFAAWDDRGRSIVVEDLGER